MACNCGAKKKGSVNYFSTEQQAAIARQRGGVVTTAKSRQTPTKAEQAPAPENLCSIRSLSGNETFESMYDPRIYPNT